MHQRTLDEVGIRTRGGLHLAAAGLRLDGSPGPGLRWLPCWDGRRRRGGGVLCARPLATVLGSRTPPMAVPYATPFQLGKYALELLPAGTGWGASMLRLGFDGATVLVAHTARLDALPGVQPLAWREADLLLVHAAEHRERADVATLMAWVADTVALVNAGRSVTVRCAEPAVALAVWQLAAAAVPVVAAPWLVRLARLHRNAGQPWPATRRRPPLGGPRLQLDLAVRGAADALPAVDVLRTIGPVQSSPDHLDFSAHATGLALLALVKASGVRCAWVWGDGAATAVAALRQSGLDAKVVATDRQLPLV